MDQPDPRKVHRHSTPRLGGVGVYAAFLLALWLCRPIYQGVHPGRDAQWWTGYLLGSLLILAVGTIDDFRPLSARLKLLAQTAAALVVISFGCQIDSITLPGGLEVEFGIWAVPLTVLWIVAVTNAFNLIDGLDGLASGVGFITALTLVVMIGRESGDAALLCAALAGSLLGFLRYNFHPATIFLGDSGSLFIGFTLAVVGIQTSYLSVTATSILIPLLAFGFPLADVLLTIGRRLLRVTHVVEAAPTGEYRFFFGFGRSLFKADREHIHHRLLRLGYTHQRAVLLIYGICAVLAAGALVLVSFRNWNNAVLLVVVGMALAYAIRKLEYKELQFIRNGQLLAAVRTPLLGLMPFQMFADLASIALAFGLAVLATGGTVRDLCAYLPVLPLVALAKLVSLYLCRLYRVKWRQAGLTELFLALKACLVAGLAGYTVLAVSRGPTLTLTLVLVDFYLLSTLLLATRFSHRVLQAYSRHNRKDKRTVLVYGASANGARVMETLLNDPAGACVPVGFIDKDPAKTHKQVAGYPVLGTPGGLSELLKRGVAQELVLAGPEPSSADLEFLRAECARYQVGFRRFQVSLTKVEPFGAGGSPTHGPRSAGEPSIDHASGSADQLEHGEELATLDGYAGAAVDLQTAGGR